MYQVAEAVRFYSGVSTPQERETMLTESIAPFFEDFQSAFEWDPKPMCEAFTKKNARFSFNELEREILGMEGGDGRRRHFQRLEETITTSQTAAAIGLVVIHAILDSYAEAPAIFRELAEMETSNGDAEVYPEEFMDDLPVPTQELEEAAESRYGASNVRIKNYGYARALSISKRVFDMDKTGTIRRLSTNFGKKYPIAQDRAWINGIFRSFVPANLESNGGIIPATNIAGYGPGNGFGSGPAYQGVNGIPAGYATTSSQITPTALENALLASATFVDPYGVEIGASLNFDTLLVDSLDRFKAKRFVSSNVNPVQLLASDGTNQQPGAFTDNILKGEFTVAHSPYVKKTRAPLSGEGFPWAMFEAKNNGLVMQINKEWAVEQELSLAGKSFDSSAYRWRGDGWFGTGPRTGRLTYVGN